MAHFRPRLPAGLAATRLHAPSEGWINFLWLRNVHFCMRIWKIAIPTPEHHMKSDFMVSGAISKEIVIFRLIFRYFVAHFRPRLAGPPAARLVWSPKKGLLSVAHFHPESWFSLVLVAHFTKFSILPSVFGTFRNSNGPKPDHKQYHLFERQNNKVLYTYVNWW